MCRPTGKKHIQRQKHASGDRGRELFLLLLFLKLSVISRSWQKHTLLRGTVVVFLMILILQFLYLYYVRYWVGYDNLLVLDEAWHMQKTGHISPDFMIPISALSTQSSNCNCIILGALGSRKARNRGSVLDSASSGACVHGYGTGVYVETDM